MTIDRPRCDWCGGLGSYGYGQMMPWPHSGWVVVRLSEGATRDFCSAAHAVRLLAVVAEISLVPTR
ncbi:MAG TPA: hypothetical protein VHW47_08415 [Acidimicrobiales bacterium]|nr:hypothetical protein [Acidimicrobiales bacterium]